MNQSKEQPIPIAIKNKIVGEANWRSTNGHGGVDDITRDNFIQAAEYGYSLSQTPIAEGEERLLVEISELKAWKESAMSVMSPMQEIGKALGVRLGESIHDKILPGIERLKGLIEDEYKYSVRSDILRGGTYYTDDEREKEVEKSWQQFKIENSLLSSEQNGPNDQK